jgi:hypothetical protein
MAVAEGFEPPSAPGKTLPTGDKPAGQTFVSGSAHGVALTFCPQSDLQAALRGETPTRRQQPEVVERVRMVPIDDAPDEDGN